MKKNVSRIVILIGIILIVVGVCIKVPGTELTTLTYFEGKDNYSVIDEYVGGDAYNYIIGASLVAGKISGILTMKAIFISVGVLIFCIGLICSSFVNKDENSYVSMEIRDFSKENKEN